MRVMEVDPEDQQEKEEWVWTQTCGRRCYYPSGTFICGWRGEAATEAELDILWEKHKEHHENQERQNLS